MNSAKRGYTGDVDVSRPFVLRPLSAGDQDFLFEMLYLSIFVPPGTAPPDRRILREAVIRRYVEDWGRPGDSGFVAQNGNGVRVGALWLRHFTAENPGYGFVADGIPELGIAIRPESRGQGIGTALMTALLENPPHGIPGISLSVQRDNPAHHLYLRLGFTVFKDEGNSLIMRYDVLAAPDDIAE